MGWLQVSFHSIFKNVYWILPCLSIFTTNVLVQDIHSLNSCVFFFFFPELPGCYHPSSILHVAVRIQFSVIKRIAYFSSLKVFQIQDMAFRALYNSDPAFSLILCPLSPSFSYSPCTKDFLLPLASGPLYCPICLELSLLLFLHGCILSPFRHPLYFLHSTC